MSRCQHCYSLIREAVIVIEQFSRPLPVEQRSAWLDADTWSPFCYRMPCDADSHGQLVHEIRHAPMPRV